MNYDRLVGEKAQALAHAAVAQAGKFGLPVSRQNYEILLVCLLRTSPDLAAALRELVANGGTPSEAEMDQLYERYFSRMRFASHVMETGSRISLEIADALDALKKVGATTQAYGSTLASAAQSLASTSIDGEAVKRLVSVLAGATKDMSKENSALSTKLAHSSVEMEKLRASLRQARTESLTDGLTGVANRKLFDETLRARKEEADANATSLALVMCDIDHFKTFNDTWGHQTGDQVIRFVATSLTKFALPDYLVARYGGEEFAIVMPRTSLSQAGGIAEKMRTAIATKRLLRRSTNEMIGAVTVSFGVSLYAAGEPVNQLISRADQCLYLSKRSGRNRVTLETAAAPETPEAPVDPICVSG